MCLLITYTGKESESEAMANLNSVLKSTDITLLTKLPIVKAMVSPVVMYRYESWTIKKSEQTPGDSGGQGSLACCHPGGRK